MGASRVVVTGAAGALGRVVARHVHERGHPLVLVDLDEAAGEVRSAATKRRSPDTSA